MSEKLLELEQSLKALQDAVGAVQRAAAQMRHEYTGLTKQVSERNAIARELEDLKHKFTTIQGLLGK
jgi:hypothetical protein